MDTHNIYEELTEDKTFPQKQSKKLIGVFREFATKRDLEQMKDDLRKEIQLAISKLEVRMYFVQASTTGLIIAAIKFI